MKFNAEELTTEGTEEHRGVQSPTLSRAIRETRVGNPLGLIDFEMEDVGDLEVSAVVEDQVAADNYVDVIRGRRGKHDFEFAGAGLHFPAQAGGKSTPDN